LIALIDRVDLIDLGIRVSLKLPNSITEERQGANATELTITRVFPMQIRRRGFEMRLIVEGSGSIASQADPALLKLVARAHRWSDDLLSGRARSVAEIAARERVGARHVRRLLRLAFLAPEIVEAIAAGRQPPELTAEALAKRIDLPVLWNEQLQATARPIQVRSL